MRISQDKVIHLFGSHGYRVLETPILEPTELFLRKSGGELASQMFSFLDPASQALSLRPELTAPLMLHYLEHADDIDLPVRWQYAGPVFRFDPYGGASTGQFTQVGAELIGAASVMADAELLSLASQAPKQLGLGGLTLELADLQVLHRLLDTVDLSERARSFIVGAIPQLRQGKDSIPALLDRARQLHLTGHDAEDADLRSAIAGLDDQRAREVLKGFLGWTSGDVPQFGQRDPDEVVHRLLRKLRGTDDRGALEQGLELARGLATIRGEPQQAISAARKIMDGAGAQPRALDRLADLVDLLQADLGLREHLLVDFGLARGIAYYTGIIFEVTHPAWQGSLGGGGRYDALARALGASETVPAAGFAYSLEALHALAQDQQRALTSHAHPAQDEVLLTWPSSVLVLYDGLAGRRQALLAAQKLRGEGALVELDVCEKQLPEAMAYAGKKGIATVLEIDSDGHAVRHQTG